MLLQLYVRQQKLPLILDLEAGEEVWNYPVYQYQVEYQESATGWTEGVLHLVAADDNVEPDFIGMQSIVNEYTFRVKLRDGAVVMGSGEWTGHSIQDHPDFAWYPFVSMAENPEVDVDVVSEILGSQVSEEWTRPSEAPTARIEPPASSRTEPSGTVASSREEGPILGQSGSTGESRPGPEPPNSVLMNETLTPYELAAAVVNKTSHFALDLVVDRGDGGRYRVGEPIRVSVRSGEAGYLYLFDADAKGNLRLIFPLAGEPNAIRAKVLYVLPPRDAKPPLVARGRGQHNLKGIVTPRPLRIGGTRQVTTGRQRQAQADEPEAIVLHPTAVRQMKRMIADSFAGDNAGRVPPPGKLGRFAQDACLYFVLEPREPISKLRFAGLFLNP